MTVCIRELYIFPIKSGAPVAVREMTLGPRGPVWDRHWMVVDETGRFQTQREHGRLAGIRPEWVDGQWFARLPDGTRLAMASPRQTEVEVEVWGDRLRAWDCGPSWSEALQRNFGASWRLVEMKTEHERWLKNPLVQDPHPISFADAEPILLVNQGSVEELERRMQTSLGALRFRPNVVVSGLPAFAEKDVAVWRAQDFEFHFTKLCSRCVMITLNPETGEREVPRLLKELAKDQMDHGKIRFGVHIVPKSNDVTLAGDAIVLRVGDELVPASRRATTS